MIQNINQLLLMKQQMLKVHISKIFNISKTINPGVGGEWAHHPICGTKQLHGAPRLQLAMTALRATWSTRKPSNCKVSLGFNGETKTGLSVAVVSRKIPWNTTD